MYIKKRVQRVATAAVFTTSVALAVAAAGAVRSDSTVTSDRGSSDVPPGAGPADSPPGSRLTGPGTPAASNVTVDHYEVVDGDSFWAIAELHLPDGATDRDVWALTEALMADNGPRLGYHDPAMLQPGDTVDVASAPSMPPRPDAVQPAPPELAPVAHQVVAGDSYWVIAESILGDDAAPGDVLDKTEDLIALNGPRLGYADPQMLHPGDIVYLGDASFTTNVPDDQGVDTESAGTTPWTALVPVDEDHAVETPTSPPPSEVALLESATTPPLTSATPGTDPVDKRVRNARDLHRGTEPPSNPPTPEPMPGNVSAS